MSLPDLSTKAFGTIPAWLRFMAVGFALAGSYYKFDNALIAHDDRMGRIDRRLDYLDDKINQLSTKVGNLSDVNTRHEPMLIEVNKHLDDLEIRVRQLELRLRANFGGR